MDLDTEGWSGDGDFTQIVIERLRAHPGVEALRIEDAPASREDTGYSFISNEMFVRPATRRRTGTAPRWRVWRGPWHVSVPAVSLVEVEKWLSADEAIGTPDFADQGMLQYLRTQRIVPHYQTRGYKLVELVRIYLAAAAPR